MPPTYYLNEAKMSMKARKWKQRKNKNDQMVSFTKASSVCLFFFLFQFSQVMS